MPPPENERLATLEANVIHGLDALARIERNLREHMDEEREGMKVIVANQNDMNDRINSAHGKIKTLNTHLAWIKGIWAVCQASILGWLGLKH